MARFAKWPFRRVGLSNASYKRTSWTRTEGELALSIRERRPSRQDRGADGDETFMRFVINLPRIYAAQNF